MRFAIKQVSCGNERIGNLSKLAKSPTTVIETPTAALLTQGGSVVHLTADVLTRVFPNPQLLWIPLSNSIHLENGTKAQGDGLVTFSGLKGHVSCTSLNSMSETTPAGHFELDKVPLWTKNGKKMISADRYMDVMEVFKPDMIVAIADGRTSLDEGYKRLSKSVDRTCHLLDRCITRYKASKQLQGTSIIGVLVGAGNSTKCDECIKHILKHKDTLTGIALAGVTDGNEDPLKISIEKLEVIFKKVGDSLPKDLIKIIEGSWNPAVVMTAIEHGWDLFDGSYPLKLTNTGHALKLNFDVTKDSDELCISNASDERYKDDFRPILEDCNCLACKKHTRAYIRHLLNTREMLASVLLNIHNLYHFDQMFYHARRHIAANTFRLYKQHITKQYELYRTSQLEKEKDTSNAEIQTNECVQQKKKIRVTIDDISHMNVVNDSSN